MVWKAPMTAVAGALFSANDWNEFVRDNLNQTAPALATAASQIFVSTGVNAITVRVPATARVETSQSTSSSTYTNLATVGPAITVTTGTIAIVSFAAHMQNNLSDNACIASVQVSGASSVAASDNWAIVTDGVPANQAIRIGMTHVFSGLTAGSNTFTMKYRRGAGSSSTPSFSLREINVIPL